MRTLSRTVAAALIVLSTNVLAFGDIRITFARGRTSATVTGRISGGGRTCYFAGAHRGQRFTATVSSRSGRVQIFESGETSYTYEVETAGDQSVCVDNLAGATRYALTVSIR
jgi:hypothetical protein